MDITRAGDITLGEFKLSGAVIFCTMPDDAITGACYALTKCHPHHFAVCMHNGRRGMLLSETAHRCLKDSGLFDVTDFKEAAWTP